MKLDKTNITRLITVIVFLICFSMIWWPGHDSKKVLAQCLIAISCFHLGFISRHPHPKEKSFITWLGILKLKLQIAILNKNLKGYPDLKKYRGRPGIKNSVKEWRLELKELKNDLKKLVK